MSTTTTARMKQIADDLRAEGAYTSANSVDALVIERDQLLEAALPFCNITQEATASIGEVSPAQVDKLREVVYISMVASEQWLPK